MLTNVDKKNAKKRQKFICEACDFVCFKKSDFIRHEATRKHKMLTNVDKMLTEKCQKTPDEFQCECGKVFKHRQSLSVHRKKCQIIPAEVCPPVAVQSTPNRCENQKDQIIED